MKKFDSDLGNYVLFMAIGESRYSFQQYTLTKECNNIELQCNQALLMLILSSSKLQKTRKLTESTFSYVGVSYGRSAHLPIQGKT